MSTTLVLIVFIILVSLYCWQRPELQQKFMMNPYQIFHNKEYFRFVTSGFIHSGYLHLFFNAFTLFFFGTNVEWIFANIFQGGGLVQITSGFYFNYFFILFFIVGVVISDLPTFFKHKDKIYYNSLGASGGVSAVVFASILFQPLNALSLMFIPIRIPGFILGALFLAYSFQMSKNSNDNINHEAHLYGSLFGIVACIVIQPSVIVTFFNQLITWNIFEWQWLY